MNIQSIKQRANNVLMVNKIQYTRVLTIVLILSCIPSLFNYNFVVFTIIYYALTILLLPVSHGVIVASLKMVRNNAHLVNDDDGLVCIKRFKDLFPTYFIFNLIEYLIIFLVGLVLGLIFGLFFNNAMSTLLTLVMYSTSTTEIVNQIIASPSTAYMLVLFLLVVIVVSFIIDAYFMAVPYLLEQYDIRGMKAVKTSYNMMKGHVLDYIKLYFSFFGWMVLFGVIETLIGNFISAAVVVSIIVGLGKIFTYLPLYYISRTVMFEEIAFYYFGEGETVNEGYDY